jgi:hypothetical protein
MFKGLNIALGYRIIPHNNKSGHKVLRRVKPATDTRRYCVDTETIINHEGHRKRLSQLADFYTSNKHLERYPVATKASITIDEFHNTYNQLEKGQKQQNEPCTVQGTFAHTLCIDRAENTHVQFT